jgi:hypothetical protein
LDSTWTRTRNQFLAAEEEKKLSGPGCVTGRRVSENIIFQLF